MFHLLPLLELVDEERLALLPLLMLPPDETLPPEDTLPEETELLLTDEELLLMGAEREGELLIDGVTVRETLLFEVTGATTRVLVSELTAAALLLFTL